MPAGAPPEQIDGGRVGLLGAGVVAQLVESAGERELGDAELSGMAALDSNATESRETSTASSASPRWSASRASSTFR